MKEQFSNSLNTMLEEKNFLGAYLLIKAYGGDEILKLEFTGKLVQRVIDELSKAARLRNKETVSYLRSLLLMIFEEVPSLSRIYRQQLRQDNPNPGLLDFLNPFKDFPQNQDELNDNIKDTVDGIKKNIEDNTDDRVKDFFKQAEKGISDGFNQFSSFINDISKSFEKGMKEGAEDQDSKNTESEKSQKVDINKNDEAEEVEGEVVDSDESPKESGSSDSDSKEN
ncbi:MAG: hypothetical protein JXR70_10775 [Spirochaetales bacterium]|nr:hypothetical protein [Spirochaetales bacterium]